MGKKVMLYLSLLLGACAISVPSLASAPLTASASLSSEQMEDALPSALAHAIFDLESAQLDPLASLEALNVANPLQLASTAHNAQLGPLAVAVATYLPAEAQTHWQHMLFYSRDKVAKAVLWMVIGLRAFASPLLFLSQPKQSWHPLTLTFLAINVALILTESYVVCDTSCYPRSIPYTIERTFGLFIPLAILALYGSLCEQEIIPMFANSSYSLAIGATLAPGGLCCLHDLKKSLVNVVKNRHGLGKCCLEFCCHQLDR